MNLKSSILNEKKIIVKTKETKDFGDVIISSDFECGNGILFQQLNMNRYEDFEVMQ